MNTSKPAKGENPTTKEHQQVKPKYNKRTHTNRRKGKPTISRQGGQRDITESHTNTTIEDHPTKTASKAEHQEAQKQTKRVIKTEERKKEPAIKTNGRLPTKRAK